MQFDQLRENWHRPQSAQRIPEGWGQGRATFGGLVAAMLYEQMSSCVDAEASLRSLTFSFVAPVASGGTEVTANPLRSGRSVTQVEGRMLQDGKVVLAALASFGRRRESGIHVSGDRAPAMRAPDECPALPDLPDIIPEFTQHFDFRIAAGDLPFSGSSNNRLGGWVRFRTDEETRTAVSIAHLLALIDAWPPALLPMLKQPAPASSLTWTIEFVEPLPTRTGGDWWQYLADVEQAADGYGVIQAKLWSAEGKLVGFSRQTVTVFG